MPDITQNPGYKLRELLYASFPMNSSVGFLNEMDRSINADGEFYEMVYNSSINYLLRRLISNGVFLKKKYENTDYPSGFYSAQIRTYVKNRLNLPKTKSSYISELLITIIDSLDKKISPSRIREVLKIAHKANNRCYLCSNELHYFSPKHGDSEGKFNPFFAEVEHIWPHSLGGTNELYNLSVSCARCNKGKENYIDSSDFHYESMNLQKPQIVDDDGVFSKEFRIPMRVAVSIHNECKCNLCNRTATISPLFFRQKNPDENWHFLNIQTLCDNHS